MVLHLLLSLDFGTESFINSNNISLENYVSGKYLESYFQTKIRCPVSKW